MKEKILKYFPPLTHIPLCIVILANLIVYEGSLQINGLRLKEGLCHNITTSFDRMVPLIPFFVVFYVLAYLQWVCGFVVIMRDSRKDCAKFICIELAGKLICLIVFLLYPTTLEGYAVTGTGFFPWVVRFIRFFDFPTNLFPSIHCFESWLCFRLILKKHNEPAWFKWINSILTFLILASVLFIKQHVILDVISGIAVAELSILIVRLSKPDRIIMKIYKRKGKV